MIMNVDGVLDDYRMELSGYFSTMQKFNDMDPAEVFQSLSAFTGRASEMRSTLVEQPTKKQDAFRTKIVDKFIEECDRQFKFHSRITAIHEMDLKMAGGRFT